MDEIDRIRKRLDAPCNCNYAELQREIGSDACHAPSCPRGYTMMHFSRVNEREIRLLLSRITELEGEADRLRDQLRARRSEDDTKEVPV